MCNLALVHGEVIVSQDLYSHYVPLLYEILNCKLTRQSVAAPTELEKVQLGSIDCLAITVKSAIHLQQSKCLLVEDILNRAKTSPNESFQICMVNSFTSCIKHLSLNDAIQFANQAVWVLFTLITGIDRMDKTPSLVSASLQCLMHVCYKVQKSIHSYSIDLLNAVLKALKCNSNHLSHAVRLSGLKLLSAVLVAREEVVIEHASLFLQIQKELFALSTMDTSSQVRQLAQQLVQIITPNQSVLY